MSRTFTVASFAKLIGLTPETVRRHIKAGSLPAVGSGRDTKITTLSTAEQARVSGVSQRTIQRRIKAGTQPGVKLGNRLVIPVAGVHDEVDADGSHWEVQADGERIPYLSAEAQPQGELRRRRGATATLEEAKNYAKPVRHILKTIFKNSDRGEKEGFYFVLLADDTNPKRNKKETQIELFSTQVD